MPRYQRRSAHPSVARLWHGQRNSRRQRQSWPTTRSPASSTIVKALYTYEGTFQMQNLIVGKAVTGFRAFLVNQHLTN